MMVYIIILVLQIVINVVMKQYVKNALKVTILLELIEHIAIQVKIYQNIIQMMKGYHIFLVILILIIVNYALVKIIVLDVKKITIFSVKKRLAVNNWKIKVHISPKILEYLIY